MNGLPKVVWFVGCAGCSLVFVDFGYLCWRYDIGVDIDMVDIVFGVVDIQMIVRLDVFLSSDGQLSPSV